MGNCTVEINQNNIANINPFRYRGYYYDTESGLYYLMSRYYDPEIGQFISMDTPDYLAPETIGGVDLYAYCNNNPVMYVDPSGHEVEWGKIGTIAFTAIVGLELRSTGLQWFISFYLIFLVESQENHKNAILLLDEAGLTLHPLAQKDLSRFFDNLSINNQIINTTHSPFIVDTTNIDRCRVVYMDDKGFTVASSNLRQGADA